MNWFSRILYSCITRGWDDAKVEAYGKALHYPFESQPTLAAAFQNVDAKATGLLTHASMMIAGLGLMSSLVAKSPLAEMVVIFQILVYLLIAMSCLRCLSIFRAYDLIRSAQDIKQILDRELIIRREIYSICNRISIVFTAFVFVSLPLMWFFKP